MEKKPPRHALADPYLAFLETSLAYGEANEALRVHLVARWIETPPAHAATCGASAHQRLWVRTIGANPAFSRRFVACRKCAARHPPHFETIPRTL